MDEVYRVEVVADFVDKTEPGLSRTRARVSSFERGLARTEKRLHSMGRGLNSFGRSVTRWVTMPILGAAAASVKLYMDFQKSMTDIRALVGASTRQMRMYEKEVLRMGRSFPQGPQALADALYFVTSSGFEGAAALRVLRASAKAAAAGLGDTQTVADAVTSAVNAYGERALSASKATDILLATVRLGKAEPTELAGSIGRVIAPAETMGVAFEEVGAALAGLSLTGLDAAEAVTGLRGVLMTVMNPTVQGKEALKELGLTTDDLRDMIERDFMGALVSLRHEFGDDKEAIGKLFGNVRALNAFLSLTGRNVDKNRRIFQELGVAVGETDRAFREAKKDPMFKYQKAMSNLKTTLIEVAPVIMPLLTKLLHIIERWARAIGRMKPEELEKWVKILGGLALVGPGSRLLGGAFRLGGFGVGAWRGAGRIGMGTTGVAGTPTAATGAAQKLSRGARFGRAAARGSIIASIAAPAMVPLGKLAADIASGAHSSIKYNEELTEMEKNASRLARTLLTKGEPAFQRWYEAQAPVSGVGQDMDTWSEDWDRLQATVTRAQKKATLAIMMQERVLKRGGISEVLSDQERKWFDVAVAANEFGLAQRIVERALRDVQDEQKNTKDETDDVTESFKSLKWYMERLPRNIRTRIDLITTYGSLREAAQYLKFMAERSYHQHGAGYEPTPPEREATGSQTRGGNRSRRQDAGGTVRVRGPGVASFRIGPITEDVTFSPGGRKPGSHGGVIVRIEDGAVRINADVLDENVIENVAGILADKVGAHLGNKAADG